MDIRVIRVDRQYGEQEAWNLVANNYEITKEINTLPSITFSVLKDGEGKWKDLEAEGYVVSEDGKFTIKEINIGEEKVEVFAVYDFELFQYSQVVGQIVSATTYDKWVEALFTVPDLRRWEVTLHVPEGVQPSQQYIDWSSYEKTPTKYEGLQIISEMFGGEFVVDNVNKKIDLYEARHCGENRGSYIIEDFNALDGTVEINSEDCFTWLYPYGKNGLTISSVTSAGEDWILNKNYINKNIEATWIDERYTDARSLYNAALRLLNERCKPAISFSLSLLDIYRISGDEAFQIELGDTIRLVLNGEESEQVVMKIIYNEENPANTELELSSVSSSLVDRIINIEKREISGSSGGGGTSVNWNEIIGKPTTFPPSSHNHDDLYYTESETDAKLDEKQETLVSGTNIKTINNQSILGSGNINIQGGGGSSTIAACSARGTTNVTLNQNPPKKLTLNTIIANTDSDSFELYNGGIRCKKAGTVSVGGACYLSMTKAGSIGTYIWLNSSELNSSLVYPGTTSVSAAINVSPMIINVSENDVFYLYGRQTASAGTANTSNVATHLSIMYLA